jgi:hypothetical protein
MRVLNARMRFAALRQAGWADASRQIGALAQELATAALLRTAFRGASLRHSRAFRWLLAAASRGEARLDSRLEIHNTKERADVPYATASHRS